MALIGLIWGGVLLKFHFARGLLAPRAIYVGLSGLMFTFAATLTLTLAAAIARDRGYRLTSRRSSSGLPPPSTPA